MNREKEAVRRIQESGSPLAGHSLNQKGRKLDEEGHRRLGKNESKKEARSKRRQAKDLLRQQVADPQGIED